MSESNSESTIIFEEFTLFIWKIHWICLFLFVAPSSPGLITEGDQRTESQYLPKHFNLFKRKEAGWCSTDIRNNHIIISQSKFIYYYNIVHGSSRKPGKCLFSSFLRTATLPFVFLHMTQLHVEKEIRRWSFFPLPQIYSQHQLNGICWLRIGHSFEISKPRCRQRI